MNEFELIQGLRNADEAAFKYLVDTYQDRVFNTAIGIVQNAEDAEDVAQEVFIQVYRSIHGFKGESKLSTWLYRIATTRALDLLRSRKSKKRFGFMQRLFGDGNEPLHEIPDFNHPVSTPLRKPPGALPHYLSAASASYLLSVFPIVYVYG